uniref:Uncharacterized protein TCIL3000_11_16450 n=1 Tax=Trypanosoma congolense (strain IL3000) TaxID=1068625 RepID=G0V3B0_TRYCI|nr:unnamed protein product [Trypanosoma congolense IL3000]
MLRLFGMFLRRSNGRRVPRAIDEMPGAPLRHGWGAIGRMTPSDHRELLEGEWTHAQPVRLIPDPMDRDAGGFVDGVSFANDEEAEAFLMQEDKDDNAECAVPSVQLARNFFEQLAVSADEDVDAENIMDSAVVSNEERGNELRGAHQRFFSEYYQRQGLIAAGEEQRLIDAVTRPPDMLLLINGAQPFVRLAVRWQLLQHAEQACRLNCSPVFTQHPFNPLLFKASVVPAQNNGDLTALPPPPNVAVLPAGVSRCTLNGGGESNLELGREIQGKTSDESKHFIALPEGDETCSPLTDKNVPLVAEVAPLSVGHMYWLQRQVAADTLIDIDTLGLLIPLALGVADDLCGTRIILDMSSRCRHVSGRQYVNDIAAYSVPCEDEDGDGPRYVIFSLAPPSATIDGSAQECTGRATRSRDCCTQATLEDILAADDIVEGNVKARRTGVQPEASYHAGAESRVVLRVPTHNAWEPLRAACDYVLCCPDTTGDGCRPRLALGVGDAEDAERNAAVNHFIFTCSHVNKLFPYQRSELTQALQYARREGGRVVYATLSLNPLENEAVVASVLTELSRHDAECVYRPVSLTFQSQNRAQKSDEAINLEALLASLVADGRPGLMRWVALQGGQPEQECSYCDEDIVADIARCSWRADPLRTSGDICYICVIEVRLKDARVSLPPPLLGQELHTPESGAVRLSSADFFSWCDLDRLHKRWGLILMPTMDEGENSGRKGCVACTVAVVDAVSSLRRQNGDSGAYGVLRYGIQVDECCAARRRHNDCGDDVLVRVSLSGTLLALALSDCVREGLRASRVVCLPVIAMLELLRTGSLTSTRLHELSSEERKPVAMLDEMSRLLAGGECTVFLTVAVPEPFTTTGLNEVTLHQSVGSELHKLVLVGSARLSCAANSNGPCVIFALKAETPDEHSVLLERVVAISDALRYLLRQLGFPESVWSPTESGCVAPPVLAGDDYEVEGRVHSSVSSPLTQRARAGRGAVHDWGTVAGNERNFSRNKTVGRTRRVGKALNSIGIASDGTLPNDWVRDTQHQRRTKPRYH